MRENTRCGNAFGICAGHHIRHGMVRTYQKALCEQGMPLTAFAVDDVRAEYERLKGRGVEFRMEPADMRTTTIAVFDDTCGNLIQIYQV